jgi:4,5-dihydroxyphthalate decarboxylase
MPELGLSLACGDYDRTRDLHDGTVTPTGIDLTCLRLPIEQMFFRMARFGEFDVSELSMSTYLLTLGQDRPPFVALPVFPSRSFRHRGVYVNAASGITTPADLVGRTVGVPEYQVTAAVWIRGILAEHHGVPVESVRYRTGGLHDPGRYEKVALDLPGGVDVAPIPPGATLSQMLATGEIDALYTPREPACFADGDPRVRQLFPDYPAAEQRYYADTGIFPIMHTVVVRRELYERHRWIARSLLAAFDTARANAALRLRETAALPTMLPWSRYQLDHATRLMGPDYFHYGLHGNEHNLNTLIGYSYAQGLAARLYEPYELFAPETLSETLV